MTNFYYLNSPDPVVIGSDSLEFKALYQPPGSSARAYYPITAAETAAGLIVSAGVAGQVADTTFEPGDVRRYGAVENEALTTTTSVNTAAIQAALDSNGRIWFQPGVRYMTGTLDVHSDTIIELNGAAVTLLALSYRGEMVFHISPINRQHDLVYNPSAPARGTYKDATTSRQNIVIRDGIIDGNVANNLDPQAGGPYVGEGDRNMDGIQIVGDCSKIKLDNLIIRNCFTDGLYIGTADAYYIGPHPRFIAVTDCDLDGNGRQGCSMLVGKFVAFTNCKFRNTSNAALPSGPCAGVDIEPEYGPWHPNYPDPAYMPTLEDITFLNCEFSDNQGRGMMSVGGLYTITRLKLLHCRFAGNTYNNIGGEYQLALSASGKRSSVWGTDERLPLADRAN